MLFFPFRDQTPCTLNNLDARKNYYLAYLENKPNHIQNSLLKNWSALEDACLHEQKKLMLLNRELKCENQIIEAPENK